MNACFVACDGNLITPGVAFAHTKTSGLWKPRYFKLNPEKAPPWAYSFEANIPQTAGEICEMPYLLRIDKLPAAQKESYASGANSSPMNVIAICGDFGSRIESNGERRRALLGHGRFHLLPRARFKNRRWCACASDL